MNISTYATLIVVSLLFMSCSGTQVTQIAHPVNPEHSAPSALRSAIDQILNDTLFAQCFIGMKVVSLENDSVLYEHNSRKLFHPASNLKLFTTATALHVLDTNFRFATKISADTSIDKSTIKGNLYVKGFGDPLCTNADIDSFARIVQHLGIQTIAGDIVGDISYFDTVSWGNGWMWDDEPDPDEAFFSPLTVDHNAIRVTVQHGHGQGKPLNVLLDPNTHYLGVNNYGVTSSDTTLPQLSVTRQRGENIIAVRGRLSQSDPSRNFTFSVRHPEMYFLHLLKEHLAAHGITLAGQIRIDTVRSMTTLAELSHPLDSVLYHVNKESDNIGAENLLKTLAAEQFHREGSASSGLFIVKKYLSDIGIDTTKLILADGSGVSWYNAVSAADIVQLLSQEFKQKSSFRRLWESLPIAGVDGTLKYQMIGGRAMGNVRAKTGTLTGVSSLSGFVTTADRKLLAFSILSDHFPGKVSLLRDMQNKIMEIFAGYTSASQ